MPLQKLLVTIFAIAVGVYAAYGESNRVIIKYVNICDDVFHQYTRVSNYNPANCGFAFIRPCYYESPVDLGVYTYEVSLKAAGAVPSAFNGCYVVQ